MNGTSLVDELISGRRIEEIRENIQDALNAMNSRPKFGRIAAHAYTSLADIWSLTPTNAARLLDISESDYAAWKCGQILCLGVDELEKISCLMGIYKYLMTLSSGNVNRVSIWIFRSNRGAIFNGKTPYELLAGTRAEVFHLVQRDLAAATV